MVAPYDYERLVKDAKKSLNMSLTELRYRHNRRIFDKFFVLMRRFQSGEITEKQLHNEFIEDFELFALVYFRPDNHLPMYTAPWQSKIHGIIEKHTRNLFILCRKVGKTAFLSPYMLWKCISKDATRFVYFAPTEGQLFGYQDAFLMFDKMPFLAEEYIQIENGGKKSYETTIFAHNWSLMKPMNLAQKQRSPAATKRGEKASDIIVDEIGLVKKNVREVVIDDMMADAYSEKKMTMVGTPDKLINPYLEIEWEEKQVDPDIGTFTMDIWDGVREGCIAPDYVRDRFKTLRIQCPWGRYVGICGKEWRKGPYDRYTLGSDDDFRFKFTYSGEEDRRFEGWECNECCKLNPTFLVENLGRFPDIADVFFPKPFREHCAELEHPYNVNVPNPREGAKYVMGIDFGAGVNPTQITVWEVIGHQLRLNYWKEVPVVEAQHMDGTRSYDPIIHWVQDTYDGYGRGAANQIKRIYADGTTVGQQVTNDLTKGRAAIPKSKIFCNKSVEKGGKGWLGVWCDGPYKSMMMVNYQKQMMDGNLEVSRQEPFWSQWMFEHDGIQVAKAGNDNYLKFSEPPGGYIDLVDSCALACLELSDETNQTAPFMGYVRVDLKLEEEEIKGARTGTHRKAEIPIVVIR